MSNNFSSVVRAGRDAELRYIPSGVGVMNVTVASSTGFGDKKKTLWIRLNYWGKGGEKVTEFIKKGSQMFVTGELSMNEYEKSDGTKGQSLELNVSHLDLIGSPPQQQQTQQEAPQATQQGRPQQKTPNDNYPFDDDIPFN